MQAPMSVGQFLTTTSEGRPRAKQDNEKLAGNPWNAKKNCQKDDPGMNFCRMPLMRYRHSESCHLLMKGQTTQERSYLKVKCQSIKMVGLGEWYREW